MQFDNILCVCTGNICRSPLAQAYLAQRLPCSRVASAGTHALVGASADDNARAVASEHDLDLAAHRARQLDEQIAREQNLILVMEQGQLEWVRAQFSFARGGTFVLSHWRDREDVTDPYRHSREYFESVFQRIRLCLDDWVDRLLPARRA